MARELSIRITADNTDAQAKLGQTEQKITGVTRTASASEEKFRKLGAAIGAAFSLNALTGMSREAIAATGRLQDLSVKLGISAEAAQELKFAAEQSGGSLEQIGVAMALMGSKLTDGDKSTVSAMGKLGLSIEAIRAMQPDQAFQTIAGAIAGIEDPMQRSQVAMDLFGRSGADLLPVITSDIQGLRDQAREMGLVLSNEVVAAGDDVGDSFEAMQGRLESAKTRALVPVLETFLSMPQGVQTALGLVSEFSGVLSGLAVAIMAAGGPVAAMSGIGTALAALGTIATGPIGIVVAAVVGLGLAWMKWGDDVTGYVSSTYAAIKEWLWDKLEPVLTPIIGLVDSVGKMFEAFALLVGAVVTKVVDLHIQMLRGITTYLLDRLRPVIEPAKALFDSVAAKVSAVATAVIGFAQRMYEGIKTWLLDRFTAVVDGIKAKVDAVTGFFADMYDAVVGNSFVPDMVDGIEAQFNRLTDVMVTPTSTATSAASGLFSSLTDDVGQTLSDGFSSWLSGTGTFRDIFTDTWSTIKVNIKGILDGILRDVQAWISDMIQSAISSRPAMQNALSQLMAPGTSHLFNEWFEAFTGPHFGGGSNDGTATDPGTYINYPEFFEPPAMATGGVVMPRHGGSVVRVAEAGQPEAIVPLDKWGGGGVTIQIDMSNSYVENGVVDRLTQSIMRALPEELRRRRLA